MIKGVVSALTVLAVVLLLYTDLTESQCTTKYCEDHDEGNVLSMCLRYQEVIEEFQHELRALRVEHDRLQQEVNSLKETVARQEKRKYSTHGRRSVGDGGGGGDASPHLLGWGDASPHLLGWGDSIGIVPHFLVQKSCEAYSLTHHSSLLKAAT